MLEEFFTGSHSLLERAYSPMAIRFFILQAHYRSTVDFSNEALEASGKGLLRLQEAYSHLQKLTPADVSTIEVEALKVKCAEAMNDDLNTPVLISLLFDAAREINAIKDGRGSITGADLELLKELFYVYMEDVLGLKSESYAADSEAMDAFNKAVDLLLEIRQQSKASKDWTTSDRIRDELAALGFEIKDTKTGVEWKYIK